MKLCLAGTVGGNLLYSLGGVAKYWDGCHDLKSGIQTKLVEPILAKTAESSAIGASIFKDFNKLFKASAGYEKTPDTKDPLKQGDHKKKQLEAKLKLKGFNSHL
jgi:hypothetical protein